MPFWPRRELLRIGALSVLSGASHARRAVAANSPVRSTERSCIFILLQGGASHIDLWDPKPFMASDIRGPFLPIETRVPGIAFGELMTRSAQVAEKLCVIRSMRHKFTNHIAGTYVTLTGSNAQPDQDREAHSNDFPGPGAVLNQLRPSAGGVPRSVSLPNWLSIPGPSNRMPGQYGGFLGNSNDPFVLEGDPNAANYNPLTLTLPEGVTTNRLSERLTLTNQLDSAARLLERERASQYDHIRAEAYAMMCDDRLRKALDLSQEPAAMRDRYGRTKIGQSLLLARRLVEAGVQYVAYNSFNQEWDTHGDLKNRYGQIVPPMDTAFGALVEDLSERGLLDRTLVVNTGEFGRTPRVNAAGGRDHWPNVYTTVLAGGGIHGGMVYGTSDSKGAEVATDPVSPGDLLATLWQQLGIDSRHELRDRQNRPIPLTEGRVVTEILG